MNAQQLKNSILQMAVQGKLVPQDPNDEPASVLLEKIRAEKERLIKEGKIKKDKKASVIFRGADNAYYEKVGDAEPVCIDDEIPFEIPESWAWARLSQLAHTIGGYSFKSVEYQPDGIRIIRISDFDDNGLLNTDFKYYKQSSDLSKYLLSSGDILMCMTGGTVGKTCILKAIQGKMYLNQRVACIRSISNRIIPDFLYFVMVSPAIREIIASSKTSTNDNISMETISSFLCPVPPLEEQKRIVDQINEISPNLKDYELKENQRIQLNIAFPDQLKKSILQEAVQGKLVPQDPNDEPASVLLERIRAEKERLIAEGKIKRDKHESLIFKRDNSHYELRDGVEVCIDDEIPFEIPDSWEWIRLPTIASLCLGKMLDKQKNRGVSCSYLRNVNVRWGAFDLSDLLNMKFEDPDDSRFLIEYNDLVMCEGGEPGRCAIWNSKQPIHFQKALHRIRFWSNINVQFFQYVFTYYSQTHFFSNLFTGSTIKHLTGMALEKVLVPLPPMHEQKRVVLKLDAVLPLCHNNVQL